MWFDLIKTRSFWVLQILIFLNIFLIHVDLRGDDISAHCICKYGYAENKQSWVESRQMLQSLLTHDLDDWIQEWLITRLLVSCI